MRAHLDSFAATARFAAGGLAAHEAMASQMLDAMGSDMRMMRMQPDSQWTALADSVKGDLAEMPSLSGQALAARVQSHVGRMRRLLDMHGSMMNKERHETSYVPGGTMPARRTILVTGALLLLASLSGTA